MEEEINWNEFKNKLIELNGKIETIEEISRHKGDKFNLFSILGIQRREVETHSFLLYDLINPKGSHYQGNLYLDIFIKEVLGIDDFEFNNLEIGRETVIPNSNRRIDLTIKNDKYYLAIEMKIDAGDEKNQIYDYFNFADKNSKEPKVYYLTLYGTDANEESSQGIDYERISFIEHISKFLEKSIEKSATLPIIRESLIQYQTTIKNITNQSTEEIQMEVIKMINNPQMARTATELSKNLIYAWATREVLFWEKLAEKLEQYLKRKKEWNLKQYVFFISDENEDFDTEENILEWIIKNGSCFYIEKNDFYFYISSFKNCNFEYKIWTDNKKIDIDKINSELNFRKSRDRRWIDTKIENGLNFSKDYANPTYDIFDDEKLEKIVEKIYEEIVYYMDKIIKSKLV